MTNAHAYYLLSMFVIGPLSLRIDFLQNIRHIFWIRRIFSAKENDAASHGSYCTSLSEEISPAFGTLVPDKTDVDAMDYGVYILGSEVCEPLLWTMCELRTTSTDVFGEPYNSGQCVSIMLQHLCNFSGIFVSSKSLSAAVRESRELQMRSSSDYKSNFSVSDSLAPFFLWHAPIWRLHLREQNLEEVVTVALSGSFLMEVLLLKSQQRGISTLQSYSEGSAVLDIYQEIDAGNTPKPMTPCSSDPLFKVRYLGTKLCHCSSKHILQVQHQLLVIIMSPENCLGEGLNSRKCCSLFSQVVCTEKGFQKSLCVRVMFVPSGFIGIAGQLVDSS